VPYKELLTNNIGWKIGGVILALMLWFHLTTEETYEENFTAEIEYSGLSEGFYVEQIEPPAAEILIAGTGKQLAYLSAANKPKIRIDLSAIDEPGDYKYDISPLEIYTIDPYEYSGIKFASGNRCSFSVRRKI
jgi:YbbR domain-containing protein